MIKVIIIFTALLFLTQKKITQKKNAIFSDDNKYLSELVNRPYSLMQVTILGGFKFIKIVAYIRDLPRKKKEFSEILNHGILNKDNQFIKRIKLIVISCSLLAGLIIVSLSIYWYQKKCRRKIKQYFPDFTKNKRNEKINIQPMLQNDLKDDYFGDGNSLIVEQTNQTNKEKILISVETEKKIIKNLNIFESKKLFVTKSISPGQMAVMLKTNTKYLAFVLKKHRDSDFYNYINDCRINYIIYELHHNPKLSQYKISVLAKMCGYTSHSQFGSIFKNKKGISPSKFISSLEKTRKES